MNLLLLYTFGMCSNKEFKTLGKSKMKNDVFDLKIGNDIYQVDYDHSSGQFTDKKFGEATRKILKECNKNKVSVGIHEPNPTKI